jgi:hypothetical protein
MFFGRIALAIGLCMLTLHVARAEKLDAEARSYLIPELQKLCKSEKELSGASGGARDRFCKCFAIGVADALTMMDLVNAMVAKGDEVRELETVFEKKAAPVLRACRRKL